ncbi:MAG: nitroreductase family protein [Dermatophilaceae bacterium]
MDDHADLVLPALRTRWSPREWDAGHELDDSDLGLLLEAARWAPSAGNSQPWAFLVGRRGDSNHERIISRLAGSSRSWAPDASAILVTAHQRYVPDSDLPYSDYALYDLGQAVAHLTIQAQAMGLHTRQFAAFDHTAVAADFDVAPHWEVTTAIAVGLPAAPRPVDDGGRTRRPPPDLVLRPGILPRP